MVREVRRTLYLLWGGVLFVLAIGAVNITNLVLIRSTARMRELATRHALGAGLRRLTRQLLTETVLLTVGGGVARSRRSATWGLTLLVRRSASRPCRAAPRSGWTALVVAFTMALALAVGVLVGLVPVLSLRHMNLSQAFREEGRSGTSGRGARTIRRVLVASQVAFAFMLLIGAGLLLASFDRVLRDRSRVRARAAAHRARLAAGTRYPDDAKVQAFARRFLPAVRAVPGVISAGLTSNIPFGGDFSDSVILAEGYQMAPGESLISPYQVTVTPGYMEALQRAAAGRPLLQRHRHRHLAAGRHRRRNAGEEVLAGSGSGRPADVQAGEPRGLHQTGSEHQVDHRRRRGRRKRRWRAS